MKSNGIIFCWLQKWKKGSLTAIVFFQAAQKWWIEQATSVIEKESQFWEKKVVARDREFGPI